MFVDGRGKLLNYLLFFRNNIGYPGQIRLAFLVRGELAVALAVLVLALPVEGRFHESDLGEHLTNLGCRPEAPLVTECGADNEVMGVIGPTVWTK